MESNVSSVQRIRVVLHNLQCGLKYCVDKRQELNHNCDTQTGPNIPEVSNTLKWKTFDCLSDKLSKIIHEALVKGWYLWCFREWLRMVWQEYDRLPCTCKASFLTDRRDETRTHSLISFVHSGMQDVTDRPLQGTLSIRYSYKTQSVIILIVELCIAYYSPNCLWN